MFLNLLHRVSYVLVTLVGSYVLALFSVALMNGSPWAILPPLIFAVLSCFSGYLRYYEPRTPHKVA